MPITVVIPFCDADCKLALDLLKWIDALGKCKDNPCVLIAAGNIHDSDAEAMLSKAKHVFKDADITGPMASLKDETHPIGPNLMFQSALLHMYRNHRDVPFLWLEPDCTPTRPTWLKDIEEEYASASKIGRKILAHVTQLKDPRFPAKIPSGVAVYPGHAWAYYKRLVSDKSVAWDIKFADEVMPKVYASRTIFSRLNRKELPVYVKKKTQLSPPNSIGVSEVEGYALVHPCKDGSLISILSGENEPSISQLLMAWRTSKEGAIAKFTGPAIIEKSLYRFIHCIERHAPYTPDEARRVGVAWNSWVELYKTGRFVPCHVWDYPRHSGGIGDDRKLPFIKDILIEGMTKAGADDIIVLTNDDTILHPKICEVMDSMRHLPAFGSMRLNFPIGESPDLSKTPDALARQGQRDLGRDLMAFRKSWLVENWLNIPDFFLGELEWDLVFATMIRKSAGVFTDRANIKAPCTKSELPYGYVLHEAHQRRWTMEEFRNAPAKSHNRRLATVWYGANGFPGMIST